MSEYHSHQMLDYFFRELNKRDKHSMNGINNDPLRIIAWGMGRGMTAAGSWMLAKAGTPVVTLPVRETQSAGNS